VSEPAEAAAVARKLLEVISHPLHELSTSSRGAVVSSLCFSWVTLFMPAFSDLGLLSRTVCSPRIQNKGFRIPGWRRKQGKPSSPQKPVSGMELPLTFQQSIFFWKIAEPPPMELAVGEECAFLACGSNCHIGAEHGSSASIFVAGVTCGPYIFELTEPFFYNWS